MNLNQMNLNHILENSKVQGPGNRYTIWVQGCSIHCKGCINTNTWEFDVGLSINVNTLSQQINKSTNQSLTITGGEPLDQFDSVLELASKVFKFKDIFLCSGYTFDTISTKFNSILSTIDILCCGPFEQDKKCISQWKGSDNQQVISFTERGHKLLDLPIYKREYRINKNTGETLITGFSI